MAIVTLDGGQSSNAIGGQTIEYVQQMVQQQVAGAPGSLVGAHLTRVLLDFYTRSTAWREYVGSYSVSKGVNLISLNPVDQNSMVQFVLSAYLFPLYGSNEPTWLSPCTRQFVGGEPALPCRYYMQKPDQMMLYPVPDQDYGSILYCYASLVPTQLSALLPDMSFTQHADALIWGVLSRMYAIPKRPWTDKEAAMMYQKDYRREILLYRDLANRGYGPADTAFRFPPFAGRSGSQVLPRASG
jgi:hypothetical protein